MFFAPVCVGVLSADLWSKKWFVTHVFQFAVAVPRLEDVFDIYFHVGRLDRYAMLVDDQVAWSPCQKLCISLYGVNRLRVFFVALA
jgi:hypothetical protein